MKKLLSSIVGGALGITLAVSVGVGIAMNKNTEFKEAEAAETVKYTLDGTIAQTADQYGNASGYAKSLTVTQNDISWEVYGNTTMSPWRIGGNSITNVDRHIYSTTKMGFENITKVVLTVGAASSITVNSLKLNVGSTKQASDVGSISATFTQNSDITFTKPSGADWRNCFFDIVFNVTVSGSGTKNKFVEFKSAKFYYNNSDPTLSSISIQGDLIKTAYTYGEAWSHDGLTIVGTFSNNSTSNLASRSAKWSYNPSFTNTGVTSLTITATVEGKTATYTNNSITVSKVASPYLNGVPYKMFLNNSGTKYYFIGSMDGYYGATTSTASSTSIVNIYFEANGDGQNIYFYTSNNTSGSKQYITITSSNGHVNFTYGTTTPTQAWYYNGTTPVYYVSSLSSVYAMGTYDYYKTFGATAPYNVSNYFAEFELASALTAEQFATQLLDVIACDGTGETAPTLNYNYTWADLKALFNQLDPSEQTTLKSASANPEGTTIENAMARYDIVVAKYGYENFISRAVSSSANRMNLVVDSNTMIIVITIVSVISITALAAYFILRKKKEA